MKTKGLTSLREELKKIEEKVENLRSDQISLEKQVDILREELKDCRERKRRADILLKSLATEKQKWMVCLRMLTGKSQNLGGDVMLAAAYITLLSGFTKKYRQRLIAMWLDYLGNTSFNVSKPDHFSLPDLLGDSIEIRNWTTFYNLPNDEHSISNAVVNAKSSRYSIFIDP